jgi:hypothetical protein
MRTFLRGLVENMAWGFGVAVGASAGRDAYRYVASGRARRTARNLFFASDATHRWIPCRECGEEFEADTRGGVAVARCPSCGARRLVDGES